MTTTSKRKDPKKAKQVKQEQEGLDASAVAAAGADPIAANSTPVDSSPFDSSPDDSTFAHSTAAPIPAEPAAGASRAKREKASASTEASSARINSASSSAVNKKAAMNQQSLATPSPIPVSTELSGDEWTSAELACALRLRLLERLRDVRIRQGHAQALHLAAITGRAYQTTRRWIEVRSPGLPDLASLRRLCEGLDCDPLWLLGLMREKRSLRSAASSRNRRNVKPTDERLWWEGVWRYVEQEFSGCVARRMRGDEMEPEICDGDTMFVDRLVRQFEGHGNYLITCDGRELVRRLEYTAAKGLVVSCANPRYEAAVFRDATQMLDHRFGVLGRIEGVGQVRRFWRTARA